MTGKNFCSMPFNSLEISPDGTCQVCCKIRSPIRKDNGELYNVLNDNLNDIWNSGDLVRLRAQFLADGRPDDCELCWTEEKAGVKSLRQQTANNSYRQEKPAVTYISLKLSNKCNLACRICSPHLSSLWQNQAEKLGWDIQPAEMMKTVSLEKLKGDNLQALHDMSEHLNHVLVYGGEPLVNDEVLQYLDFLIKSGYSKNISLTMNTNVTICTEELINTFKEFQYVNLCLSIDDVDERYEYQRWPAKWSKVDENIKRFAKLDGGNIRVRFYPSISILNIVTLENTLDRLNSYGIPIILNNIIHLPSVLSIRNFPPDLKSKIIEIIDKIDFSKYNLVEPNTGHKETIINFIKLDNDHGFQFTHKYEYRERLIHHMEEVDRYRSTLMQEYLPEFMDLLFE